MPRHVSETVTILGYLIASDALSVLQSIKSSGNKEMRALSTALVALNSAAQTVVIQWVPAHCDIGGNERAARMAKEGGSEEQPDELVSFDEIKAVIKAHQHKKWQLQHPASCPNDSYH